MISDARRGHVSPGIYTEEKDVMYSVKSLGITSLGLVGETLYGPAFQNVEISNWGEFVDYFGGVSPEKFKNGNPKYELPYVAKSYLEESNRLNVVRVLGLSGYEAGPAWAIKGNKQSENEDKPVAIVLRSRMTYSGGTSMCNKADVETARAEVSSVTIVNYQRITTTVGCDAPTYQEGGEKYKFGIKTTDQNGDIKTYYVSLNPSDSDYIYNVISSSPNGSTPIYIEAVYESSIDLTESASSFTSINIVKCIDSAFTSFKSCYRAAITPWIVSEAAISSNNTVAVSGVTGSGATSGISLNNYTANIRKLFRFITISDGDAANFQIKVSIQNIDKLNGTFDVVVRDFYDNDVNPLILETFKKCNLIEGDVNFIGYKIGTTDGGYVSKSKYILVEMAEAEDFGRAIPAGFLGYPVPKYSGCGKFEISYNNEYKPEIKVKKQYYGFSSKIDSDIFKYKGESFYGEDPDYTTNGFHLENFVDEVSGTIVDNKSGYTFTSAEEVDILSDIKKSKFTVCFYGGFDGWDINRSERTNTDNFKSIKYNAQNNSAYITTGEFYKNYFGENETNLPLDLPTTAITSDYYAYLAGCRVFANPQDIDINLFATPGINWKDNALLTQEIIDIIEDKDEGRGGDALYIMASPNDTDVDSVISDFEDARANSSYACTYFPWVMHYDASNKKYLTLPVTKDVVKNMASIDNNSYPWFAPAGTERGKVNCIKAVIKTKLSDEDALYEANINPVKSFAQDGVIIWGNKTAYPVDSPINRINVRRMMIRVKKLIMESAKHLIFEQYDETLEKQFKGIVEPILANVKSNRGIIDYRVITESTPETRDQHILPAKILIKPTQSLEYISISFTVYPESVNFDE